MFIFMQLAQNIPIIVYAFIVQYHVFKKMSDLLLQFSEGYGIMIAFLRAFQHQGIAIDLLQMLKRMNENHVLLLR